VERSNTLICLRLRALFLGQASLPSHPSEISSHPAPPNILNICPARDRPLGQSSFADADGSGTSGCAFHQADRPDPRLLISGDHSATGACPWSNRFAKVGLHLSNIYRLTIKEMRSIRSDPIILALVAFSFTVAVDAATGASIEATNLSVGTVDEDHSDLSRRIADGLTPPTSVRTAAKSRGR
jgi:hypothetical protein